jgi:hypothetical protein
VADDIERKAIDGKSEWKPFLYIALSSGHALGSRVDGPLNLNYSVMHLRSFCDAGSWLLLLQDAAATATADDQLIAGPHLAFDDFRVGTVVETESDGDRCRLSAA